MEEVKNCENCKRFVSHENSGVFGGDGLCHFDYKHPKPVRKWFTKCKYWIAKKKEA